MKKTVLIYLFFTVWLVSNSLAETGTLYLLTDDNFPPFGFEEKGEKSGIDYDIVCELAKRLDINVEIDFVPWKRLLRYTETGKCDGSFSLFQTEEREQFAIYVLDVPIHYSTFSLFTLKGNEFNFEVIKDLHGKSIGLNSGFAISDEFDMAVKKKEINVKEIEGVEKNIKKLMLGIIDCFVGNYQVTMHYLNKYDLHDRIVSLPRPVKKRRGSYMVLSKASKIKNKEKLIQRINITLKHMVDDGTFKRIEDKYLQ